MVMLRWWFIAVAQLGGLAALFATGMVQKRWAVDVTKLSIVCLIALVSASAFIGWLTYQAQERRSVSKELLPHADALVYTNRHNLPPEEAVKLSNTDLFDLVAGREITEDHLSPQYLGAK